MNRLLLEDYDLHDPMPRSLPRLVNALGVLFVASWIASGLSSAVYGALTWLTVGTVILILIDVGRWLKCR